MKNKLRNKLESALKQALIILKVTKPELDLSDLTKAVEMEHDNDKFNQYSIEADSVAKQIVHDFEL